MSASASSEETRPAAAGWTPGKHHSRRRIRLLLVDDSRMFLDAAGEALSDHPLLEIVGHATSGAEAIDCVRNLAPDVVVTDLVMPGMDGLELTRLIKRQPGAPRVVVITFHDGPDSRQGAMTAGADGFVPKAEFIAKVAPLVQQFFPGDRP